MCSIPKLSDCKLNHADSDKVCHRHVVLPQFSDCKHIMLTVTNCAIGMSGHADSGKLCHRYVWSWYDMSGHANKRCHIYLVTLTMTNCVICMSAHIDSDKLCHMYVWSY